MKNFWLIDTNVLIYSYDQNSSLHSLSYSLIKKAIGDDLVLFLSHQNLLEFLAVVTNPKRVENPLSIEEAFQKITLYMTIFKLICPLSETFFSFNKLLSRYPTHSTKPFDLYLAATALDNGINQICTWNIKDFKRIKELIVKTPRDIISENP